MIIEIPDIDLNDKQINEDEILVAIALLMYEKNIWGAKVAASFCKKERQQFMSILASNRIPFQYEGDIFWQQELQSIDNLVMNDSSK
jgi:predicted HTH domain antitoxin